jgi:hypothetical protein
MGRRAFVVVAVVTAVLGLALPAKACTCALGDPRDALARADGAFVGTLLSRRPAVAPGGEPDLQTDVFTFQVDEDVKGEYPDTLDVYSASSGAACGLEVGQGEHTGLLLYFHEDDGHWWSNLCSQMSPEDLREAAAPLPEPNGRGPARVLVAGTWGEAGHLALDGRGRTLGYGLGDHLVVDLEACPGGHRFVELYLDRRRVVLVVRRLGSNRAVWQAELPMDARNEVPVELWCPDRSGDSVVVAGPSGGRDRPGRILLASDRRIRTLYEGGLREASFAADGTAYVQRGREGRRIVGIPRLGAGRPYRIVTAPEAAFRSLAVSPDGRRLAASAGNSVTVVDLATDRRVRRKLPGARSGEVSWWGDGRVVFFPEAYTKGKVTVLDAELRRARPVDGRWRAIENAVVDGFGYGLGYGRLFRVDLRDGGVERVRSFPTYSLYAIEGVPGETGIDWPDPPD